MLCGGVGLYLNCFRFLIGFDWIRLKKIKNAARPLTTPCSAQDDSICGGFIV